MPETDREKDKTVALLNRFIDLMLLMERQCPRIVKRPGVHTRSIPDAIIQDLRTLADQADDLLAEIRGVGHDN